MQVTLSRKPLLSLVKSAAAVAKPSDSRPILRNLLLTADENGLEFSSTDMSISLWLKLPVGDDLTVHKSGKALIPAQNFQRVVSSMTATKINLTNTGSEFVLVGGGSRFSLVMEDYRDFPKVSRFSDRKSYLTIPAAKVEGLLKRIAFCAHDERSFFNMHGVLIEAADDEFRVVATNGQRLGVGIMKIESAEEVAEDLVVPASNASMLAKVMAGDDDETVDVQWMARALNVRGTLGEASLVALKGSFPPYQTGIPKNTKILTLDRGEFIKTLKEANALKSPSTSFVELSLSPAGMTLITSVRDVGASRIEREVEWAHDPISVYLNPDFLLQSAKAMKGLDISLELEGPMVQTVLREKSDDGLESFCVYSVVRDPR